MNILKNILLLMLCVFIIRADVIGQTIISNNGKYGIIDNESKKVAIPTEYDTITEGSKSESYGTKEFAHSFILKKNKKYYFALKKRWFTSIRKESKDGWRTYPPLEGENLAEWNLLNQEFDTLYRLERLDVFQPRHKNSSIYNFETYLGDTCFQIFKNIYHIIYRKDEKYGLLTFDKTSRTFGRYVVGRLRYERIEYSIDNIQIHPAKYDHIMNLPTGKLLLIIDNDKYGLIGLGLAKNIEIEPQFESPPVMIQLSTTYSRSSEQSYYYAKKDGFWGAIYLTEGKQKNYNVAIPFHYNDIKDIKSNLRNVNFYNQHFYDEEGSKRMEYKREYVACIHNSSPDTLPMQLNFIIHDGETNSPTKWNSTNNKEELNKNYIPPIEKYIKFNPAMNGKPIVQQEKHEYLITSNIQHIQHTELPTTPLFFVLKMDRIDSVYNNDYNLYKRGKIKKNEIDTNYFRKINTPFASVNQRPKAIAIYRFINDSFVPLSEFVDEDKNTTYEIVTDFMADYEGYYPERKKITYESNLILKSTKIETEKYKHTFFTFEGVKMYEITSKYPIDYWEFVKLHPSNHTGYLLSDEDFGLEFYTETTNRRGKTKKRKVCYYNVKTKQFYK